MWRLRQFDNFSPKYNNKHVTQHEQKRIYFLFYRFMSSVRLHTSPSIMVVFFFFIVSTRVVFITYLDASGKYDAVTFSRHLFQLWAFLHCYIENVMGKGNLCRTLVILRVLYIFSLCECMRVYITPFTRSKMTCILIRCSDSWCVTVPFMISP